jgi:hypothetical protein
VQGAAGSPTASAAGGKDKETALTADTDAATPNAPPTFPITPYALNPHQPLVSQPLPIFPLRALGERPP